MIKTFRIVLVISFIMVSLAVFGQNSLRDQILTPYRSMSADELIHLWPNASSPERSNISYVLSLLSKIEILIERPI